MREKISTAIRRRVRHAVVALGLVHPCSFGHDWHSVGGRACPRNPDAACSQTVYKCRRCPVYDYGERGGPAYRECIAEGPCALSCEDVRGGRDPAVVDIVTDGAGIPASRTARLERP